MGTCINKLILPVASISKVAVASNRSCRYIVLPWYKAPLIPITKPCQCDNGSDNSKVSSAVHSHKSLTAVMFHMWLPCEYWVILGLPVVPEVNSNVAICSRGGKLR